MSLIGHAALGCVLAGLILLLDRAARPVGAFLGLAGVLGFLAIGRAGPVNPEAIAAFRAVEAACAGQIPAARTLACVGVDDLVRRCREAPCTATEYHAEIVKLGYPLPELRTAR